MLNMRAKVNRQVKGSQRNNEGRRPATDTTIYTDLPCLVTPLSTTDIADEDKQGQAGRYLLFSKDGLEYGDIVTSVRFVNGNASFPGSFEVEDTLRYYFPPHWQTTLRQIT